jgi:hypothetical protein
MLGLALGLVGAAGKLFGRGRANRRMRRLLAQQPAYKANPLVAQRLGLAQTLLNARAPGASMAEKNIMQNQAGQISNINRVATDSSQALALSAGTQGATNQALNDLSMQEAADYQRRLGTLERAQDAQVAEDQRVFQDQVRRFQNQVGVEGAITANNQNTWGDIANLGFALEDFGMAGGFKNLNLFNRRRPQGTTTTTYYNGYSPNSEYSEFQSPY